MRVADLRASGERRTEGFIGSRDHRDLFCETFHATHVRYDPNAFAWPDLDEYSAALLTGLGIWSDAVHAEAETAAIVSAMASAETDPVVAEAIALQAYEEQRHATLVRDLTVHYGIAVEARSSRLGSHPESNFLESGWGEVLDSFFGFGIYHMAAEAKLVASELLELFDLVMQEEARHVVFFENWRAYRRARGGSAGALTFSVVSDLAAMRAFTARAIFALVTSRQVKREGADFMLRGAVGLESFTPRDFLDHCLAATRQRFESFDPRLLRPRLAERIGGWIRVVTPAR